MLGPDVFAFHQRIISNDSCTHDEKENNPGQQKEV